MTWRTTSNRIVDNFFYLTVIMIVLHTNRLTTAQELSVSLLWNQEYPQQIMMETLIDFESYISTLTDEDHYLYTEDEVLGWAFKFTRNQERWFAIIIDSSIHHKGIGTMLLNKLKDGETELNGWVVDHSNYKKANLQTYSSPLPFYLKNGFKVLEDIRFQSPKISGIKIKWEK